MSDIKDIEETLPDLPGAIDIASSEQASTFVREEGVGRAMPVAKSQLDVAVGCGGGTNLPIKRSCQPRREDAINTADLSVHVIVYATRLRGLNSSLTKCRRGYRLGRASSVISLDPIFMKHRQQSHGATVGCRENCVARPCADPYCTASLDHAVASPLRKGLDELAAQRARHEAQRPRAVRKCASSSHHGHVEAAHDVNLDGGPGTRQWE